jgi:hypothetical protein
VSPVDWVDWHRAYADPASPLHRRLRLVQAHIRAALDAAPTGPLRAISVCAGQGTDLLGVLADHPRGADVHARIVELDPHNATAARAAARDTVEVVTGDAARLDAYAGAAPADLVLVCGVLGRIGERDVGNAIRLLPQLTATGGTVIWTRHRRSPDGPPRIRRLLRRAGFTEIAFDAPADEVFTVGSHRHAGAPLPLDPQARLFSSFRS